MKNLSPFDGNARLFNTCRIGLKIFPIVDSRTFDTLKLKIYCGKQPSGPYEAFNSATNIVKNLVGEYEGSNHNLTIGIQVTL